MKREVLVTLRAEQPGDELAIRQVHEQAFGQPTEANIVDRLRLACPEQRSWVALARQSIVQSVVQGESVAHGIVAHLLFSPVLVEGDKHHLPGMGLAPLAVLPDFQRQGIGTQLVQHGVKEIRQASHPFVVVLGHPSFYGRFGFVPASRYGITCEYPNVPDEAFMLLALDPARLATCSGVARYRPEFSA